MQASGWPARKKWTQTYLQKGFKGQTIVAGNYDMSFDDYFAYADGSMDDMPLYLFDCKFAQKAPQLAADYTVYPPSSCKQGIHPAVSACSYACWHPPSGSNYLLSGRHVRIPSSSSSL